MAKFPRFLLKNQLYLELSVVERSGNVVASISYISTSREDNDQALKNKRILWLLNHTTLREFEIPLLLSLGFEVYTPKRIPEVIKEWSGSVCHDYDKTLSISKEHLELLNQHDFYDEPIPKHIAAIINQYFGYAFCMFYPSLLSNVVNHFSGHILLRAFGVDKTVTYGSLIISSLGRPFLDKIKSLDNRFWFSQCYPHLHEVEPKFLRSRSVYHPLGLSGNILKFKNSWIGGEKKILFFCPRINASPEYYGKVYKKFKQNFGDLPHRIAGHQPIPVKDPNVIGHQSREIIERWFKTHDVLFYHSQEPRHLHYHPLEAIIFGMPIIYMRGGILEKLGGANQPGACQTYAEAHEKLSNILRGDKKLIEEIRSAQEEIIKFFMYEHSEEHWKENFVNNIIKNRPFPLKSKSRPKKICILLPVEYKGGTFCAAKNIAKMIHLGSAKCNEPLNVVFACLTNKYNSDELKDLVDLGIVIREFNWSLLKSEHVFNAMKYAGQNKIIHDEIYYFPQEEICNFNDCNFILIISDRLLYRFAPIIPFGMVVFDYIQRYVPEIILNNTTSTYQQFLSNVREAEFVLTTTYATAQDAIQYAGVDPNNVHITPMEYQPFLKSEKKLIDHTLPENYFIWPSNSIPHKNHERAIEALFIYYTQLNGQLNVVMTGHNTHLFDPKCKENGCSYTEKIKSLFQEYDIVNKRITIKGNMPTNKFANAVTNAKFLWHPVITDNGTYSVIEAAALGVPSISSNYDQMKFINERFNLNLSFFDASNPMDIAKKLKFMEEHYEDYKKKLPTPKFLEQFNYKHLATEYWQILRGLI